MAEQSGSLKLLLSFSSRKALELKASHESDKNHCKQNLQIRKFSNFPQRIRAAQILANWKQCYSSSSEQIDLFQPENSMKFSLSKFHLSCFVSMAFSREIVLAFFHFFCLSKDINLP